MKALGRAGPALQLAEDKVGNNAVRAAKKRLAKALRALGKFEQTINSRPSRLRLTSAARTLLRNKAEATRTAIRALRDSLE